MANPNANIGGLLEGLIGTIETVVDVAGKKLSDFAEEVTNGTEEETSPSASYKAVFNLGLSDQLVLDDGAWQVVAIEEDAFDSDRVTVALDNGETYSLIRTSLVWVV